MLTRINPVQAEQAEQCSRGLGLASRHSVQQLIGAEHWKFMQDAFEFMVYELNNATERGGEYFDVTHASLFAEHLGIAIVLHAPGHYGSMALHRHNMAARHRAEVHVLYNGAGHYYALVPIEEARGIPEQGERQSRVQTSLIRGD